MGYKYSVIIPHKNSMPLLLRCVKSIPEHDDIEVLVIDDNSDVDQNEWNSFREEFSYVKLFLTKEGKGAGYARNVGLKNAVGDWLIFADADDFFYPKAFNIIKNYCEYHLFDIAYFCTNSRDGITNEIIRDRVPIINTSIHNKDIDSLRYCSYVPWGKVINKQLIFEHNIKFEEIEVSNDIFFSMLVGFYAKKVELIDECLYCCTRNINSLVFHTSSVRTKVRIEAGIRVNRFLSENGLIKYRVKVPRRYYTFIPKDPDLFIWALKSGKYEGATLLYCKDVLRGFLSFIYSHLFQTLKKNKR